MNFTADDESGVDFLGSDEPMFVFTSTNGTQTTTVRSPEFGDVDSGESRSLNNMCVVTDCVQGLKGPLSMSVQLVEMDQGDPEAIKEKIKTGLKIVGYVAAAFGSPAPNLDESIQNYFANVLGDDLMGSQTFSWSADELTRILPSVGGSVIQSVKMGEQGGDLPSFLDNPPDYTLRLKVTRMADELPLTVAAF